MVVELRCLKAIDEFRVNVLLLESVIKMDNITATSRSISVEDLREEGNLIIYIVGLILLSSLEALHAVYVH